MKLDQFVKEYLDIPDTLIKLTYQGILNYFGSIEGSFWIFYNSDVEFMQELDFCEYVCKLTEKLLDRNYVRIFITTDYVNWKTRIKEQKFTDEELKYACPYVHAICPEVPYELIWCVLMWCGGPDAEQWRAENNAVYRATKNFDHIIEYKGQIIPADSLEIIQGFSDSCDECAVICPYVADQCGGSGDYLCWHCHESREPHICGNADYCEIISCKYKLDQLEIVASTGRRFLCKT